MRRSQAPSKRKLAHVDITVSDPTQPVSINQQPALHPQLSAANPALQVVNGSSFRATFVPTVSSKTLKGLTDPSNTENNFTQCFKVMYRKQTNKVHKSWDGDGVLHNNNESLILNDESGNMIASGRKSANLDIGLVVRVGQKEVEILEAISVSDAYTKHPSIKTEVSIPAMPKMAKFKPHIIDGIRPQKISKNDPRHDPFAPNALVMPRPKPQSNGPEIVDVVVDPILTHKLRPHQRKGVTFLYKSVMGMRDHNGQGAILADEMGLGKTVQAIALIWTLLKQTPYIGGPTMKRVLIVCPASLVGNWKKEFKKWLGDQRIRVYAIQGIKSDITDFVVGKVYSVMVIGYERMRSFQQALFDAKFDMVICDEGHRLKNSSIQASTILQGFETAKRIILSGTPIQNDLTEFYAMVDFVNPGLLGTRAAFKHTIEGPILRGRALECSEEERQIGNEKMLNLIQITDGFVLRRTADVNAQYLPEKTQIILFCKMSTSQSELYKSIIESPNVCDCLETGESGSAVLPLMTLLRKCTNSPKLVAEDNLLLNIGCSYTKVAIDRMESGKLSVLKQLLAAINAKPNSKVVLVSNWTATLNIFEILCQSMQYSFVRLDGQTPQQNRQELVDKFNTSNTFLFLLSSKAGGVGLNLTGASRLIMYDIDWNPSVDQQAMARIWRDGQRNNVTIYRLLTTGTIEERIYQRQLTKVALSDSVIDNVQSTKNSFSQDELRDIFSLDTNTDCGTHEMLGCSCLGMGESDFNLDTKQTDQDGSDNECDPSDETWKHFGPLHMNACKNTDDGVLETVLSKSDGMVSYVFKK